MRRRARLIRRRPLRPAEASLRRRPLRPPLEPSLRRTGFSEASPAQRQKVEGEPCLLCGHDRLVDPAHLTPRSQGGCDHPDCVIPLCRTCHRRFDDGRADLLPKLKAHRAELAHAVLHLGLLGALRRVTGRRWTTG